MELAAVWRISSANSGLPGRYARSSFLVAETPPFQKLIEILQQQTDHRMLVSTARETLTSKNPTIFIRAGCSSMAKYVKLAERNGVITHIKNSGLARTRKNRNLEYIQLTAAYRSRMQPTVHPPPPPIDEAFTSEPAQSLNAKPSINDDNPESLFSELISLLVEMRDNGVLRPYQSTIHAQLISDTPSIYKNASVSGYGEYFNLAEKKGVVELGGAGIRQYISLIL